MTHISIHALTRRAAPWCTKYFHGRKISIHALTRRAARMPGLGHDWYNISIHALTRRAALIWRHWKEFNGISIHALTRRAACRRRQQPSSAVYFNPRSHEESGGVAIVIFWTLYTFQSTLSRGERLSKNCHFYQKSRFQSTLSRGERRRR